MITADTIVVLPAHNEEKAIGKVITSIINTYSCDIVVSASGCTDNGATVKAAKAAGNGNVHILEAPKGKGRAIQKAFESIKAKHIIMMDADATYPAKSIPYMVDLLQYHDAVIGLRKFNKANMPGLNKWGNEFITRQAQLLYGYPIHDLCTGMWAFRGNVIKAMNIRSYSFTLEAEMFVYLAKNQYDIGQLPIEYYPRIGDKKINRMDHLKIMWYLWSRRFN